MATKMISRTISERKYSVICMNIKTSDVGTNEYSLGSAVYRNNDAALKALREKYETDGYRKALGAGVEKAFAPREEETHCRA